MVAPLSINSFNATYSNSAVSISWNITGTVAQSGGPTLTIDSITLSATNTGTMAQTSFTLSSYGGSALNTYTTVSTASFQRTYTNIGSNVVIFNGGTNPLNLVNGQTYNFQITAVAGTSQASSPPFTISPISGGVVPYDSSTNPLMVGGVACFLKGTRIRCADGDIPIEDLKKGMMVKTLYHHDVAVDMIGYSSLRHSRSNPNAMDQLFTYSSETGDNLTVTGSHCRLVDSVTALEISNILSKLGSLYVTDDKIRLPACIDSLAKPYEKEESDEVVYHICLEHSHPNLNYGIYANDRLMETCQKSCMEKNMIVTNE